MPPNVNNIDWSLSVQIGPINPTVLPQRLADEPVWVAQKRYQSWHDKKVCSGLRDVTCGQLFVDKTLVTTFSAERLPTEGYSELVPKQLGPYRVLRVRRE